MTLLNFFFIISGLIIFILALDVAKKQKFNALHFLVFLGIGLGLLIFTFFPSILDNIGKFFGVARGSDLLVYTSIIFLLYFVLLLLSKYIENKESITKLIREISIENSGKNIIEGKEVFVIPAYNEGKIILSTIDNIIENGYKNIIVVNDGSNDDTKFLLEKNYKEKIILLNHFINRGQGAALETGFEYVRRYSKTNYVITFDADGQHDIKNVIEMEKIADENKDIMVLLGSRFLGEKKNNIPFFRKVILKLGILFTFFISHINLSDTHNGYRLFRRKVLNDINVSIDGMGHASEILDIISSNKIEYMEVPVDIIYTDYSKLKGQSSFNSINIAIRIIWNKFFK